MKSMQKFSPQRAFYHSVNAQSHEEAMRSVQELFGNIHKVVSKAQQLSCGLCRCLPELSISRIFLCTSCDSVSPGKRFILRLP
ncbi:unnamed protein product [Microthlaspi erraticum]|uniref:Uncharacterized protein n=1 Tax=Microthlaspi erraticum TaxID=1685480 RepID=A0A6D2JIG0_9BRAS|nr:unnamed protein product [Microthlaspi erraticum]